MAASVLTAIATDWLGIDALPPDQTIGEIINRVVARAAERWPGRRVGGSLAKRWPGYDPRPDVDGYFGIIEVYHWKTIVDRVTHPESEIALDDLPAGVRANRKVGHPWYETLAHVLLPKTNLETRPTAERGLNTLPIRKA